MKKKNIGLIAGIVLLVVLCVVYFVLHNHNANSSEEDSTDTSTTAFETDTDKLTELTVTTEGQTYTFTKSDDTWSYSGDASFPLDQDNFTELAGRLKSISSDRELDDVDDVSEYGLDAPTVQISIKNSDDETHSLEFGAVNDMTSNCYMTVDNDTSKIYMVASTLESAFEFELNDLAEKESFPSITATTVTKLTVEKQGEEAEVIEKSDSASTGWSYTKGSTQRDTDSSNTSNLLNGISSLSWGSFVSADTSNLAEYGLDAPTKITIDYQVTETKDSDESDSSTSEDSTSEDSSSKDAETDSDSESTTETVTIDKQEVLLLGSQDSSGNYYAKLESQSNIYTISSSSVESFLSIDVKTLVSSYVSNYIFADLDRVTIQKDGESYEFTKTTEEKVKEKDDSDSSDEKDSDSDSEEDSEEETETVTTYFMNGNEITLEDFSSFYSNISSLECQEWLDEVPETQDEPEMSVEFYKENGVYFKVEYYPYDSNFYFVKNNQGTACLVNKMKIKDIESSFEEFLEKQN